MGPSQHQFIPLMHQSVLLSLEIISQHLSHLSWIRLIPNCFNKGFLEVICHQLCLTHFWYIFDLSKKLLSVLSLPVWVSHQEALWLKVKNFGIYLFFFLGLLLLLEISAIT